MYRRGIAHARVPHHAPNHRYLITRSLPLPYTATGSYLPVSCLACRHWRRQFSHSPLVSARFGTRSSGSDTFSTKPKAWETKIRADTQRYPRGQGENEDREFRKASGYMPADGGDLEEYGSIKTTDEDVSRSSDPTGPPRVRLSPSGSDMNYQYRDAEFGAPTWDHARKIPKVLPRTTDTSEFLYGYNIVALALEEGRRKVHKLHVYTGVMREVGSLRKEAILKQLARKVDVEVVETMELPLLDAMSKGRPHNGFALEVEPIDIPIITQLGKWSPEEGSVKAPIHWSTDFVDIKTRDPRRKPFILILDEIVDGGNLGAMLRSAYYLGVDAVVISHKNSSPPGPITARSSAGAFECIDFYNVNNLADFITESKKNGWMFYAAMPPPTQTQLRNARSPAQSKFYDIKNLGNPLANKPVALVLGNEGAGLRYSIEKLMQAYVTILPGVDTNTRIDSLNVSVAASVICNAFLNPSGHPAEQMKGDKTISREAKLLIESGDPAEIKKGKQLLAVKENLLFRIEDGKFNPRKYREPVQKDPTEPDKLKVLEDTKGEEPLLRDFGNEEEVDMEEYDDEDHQPIAGNNKKRSKSDLETKPRTLVEQENDGGMAEKEGKESQKKFDGNQKGQSIEGIMGSVNDGIGGTVEEQWDEVYAELAERRAPNKTKLVGNEKTKTKSEITTRDDTQKQKKQALESLISNDDTNDAEETTSAALEDMEEEEGDEDDDENWEAEDEDNSDDDDDDGQSDDDDANDKMPKLKNGASELTGKKWKSIAKVKAPKIPPPQETYTTEEWDLRNPVDRKWLRMQQWSTKLAPDVNRLLQRAQTHVARFQQLETWQQIHADQGQKLTKKQRKAIKKLKKTERQQVRREVREDSKRIIRDINSETTPDALVKLKQMKEELKREREETAAKKPKAKNKTKGDS